MDSALFPNFTLENVWWLCDPPQISQNSTEVYGAYYVRNLNFI